MTRLPRSPQVFVDEIPDAGKFDSRVVTAMLRIKGKASLSYLYFIVSDSRTWSGQEDNEPHKGQCDSVVEVQPP